MRFRRTFACLLAAALTVSGLFAALVLGGTAAGAQESGVPSNAASSWQTNGIVYSLAATGGIVYAGGDFSSVRPPGAASGSGEVARTRLAAFSAATGVLTGFNHTLNGTVYALQASPDGKTVYAGGDFTAVDGAARNHIAAFSTDTGALTSWAPSVYQRVASIAVSPTGVYIGGGFTTAGGRSVQRLAELNLTNGQAVATFTAAADNYVYSIALSTDYSKLYVAGTFGSLNGDTNYYSAGVVDAATGTNLPFAAGSVIPRASTGCVSVGKVVRTDANGAYFGNEGTGGGCFDGTFAANQDGSLKWVSTCLGATQAVQPLNGTLYTGSHSHDCSGDMTQDPNAFPEVGWSKGLARHLLSRSTTTGLVGNWYPQTNGGIGSSLGPRVMATDGAQLFVGGEFTTVNGQPQQGFARFSPTTGDLAVPGTPSAPTAVARAGGKVSVFVQAPIDTDDPNVTVRLYRDGGTTPIATKPVNSLFWRQPIVGFEDNGLPVGSTHTYRADAIETNGPNLGAKGAVSSSVTVAANATGYAAAVQADNPSLNWRFTDTRGPAVADASDRLEGGTTYGGVTFAQAGATPDSTGIVTDGVSGEVASTDSVPSPSTFTVDAWFKTTSTNGGKIIGFGNDQGGYDFSGNAAVSGAYDKQVYMTNAGKLVFGVYNGGFDTLSTPTAYNDGQWHQVIGTQGPAGMALYVDGARIGRNGVTGNQSYTGYWRVGGDNLAAWPDQPSSNFFSGAIDEVSVYDHALTLTDAVAQYTASGRTAPPSGLPTDTYGKAVVADQASTYWRLDEASGAAVSDASGDNNTGTLSGGYTQGGDSAIGTVGRSTSFDGSSGNLASDNATTGPNVYSEELWFKTATTTGGKIIGFGNAQTGQSSNYDRQVYMSDDGRLTFGVYNGGFDTVTSSSSYNDSQWHYLVATQGSDGLKLYVDNVLLGTNGTTSAQTYSGYWRVGGDNLGAWPAQPTSSNFAGSVDEVAIYEGVALTSAQIQNHYVAAGHTGPDTTPPTTAITSPAAGSTVNSGTVTVTAAAADNVSVASVALQVDGETIATDTSAPYSFAWPATDGSHSLRTTATDTAGNVATSDAVPITVNTPDRTAPTVTITSPSDGDTVVSGAVPVTASANDNVGVAAVTLKVDGTTVAVDNAAPYTFTWSASDLGNHTLTAVAADAAGNTANSDAARVTVVAPPDRTPPSAPGNLQATATSANTAALTWASASDNVGVTGYKVVRDGVELAATVTGLSYTDTGLTVNTAYRYTVHALDAAGNVGSDSNAASVTTPANDAPVFRDSWDGADGSAWNSAWATSSSAGSVSTQSAAGALTVNDTAGAYARAQLTGAAAQTDAELLTSFQWSGNSAAAYLSFYLRGSGGWKDSYRPKTGIGIQIQSNSGTVRVQRNVNGTTTELAAVTGAQQVTTAKQSLRLRVVGTTVQFRIWTAGQTEPSTWQSTVADTSVTGNGQLFVSLNRGSSNTGVKTASLDDLRITAT